MSAFLTMKQQPQKLTTEIILKMADFLALELWLDQAYFLDIRKKTQGVKN